MLHNIEKILLLIAINLELFWFNCVFFKNIITWEKSNFKNHLKPLSIVLYQTQFSFLIWWWIKRSKMCVGRKENFLYDIGWWSNEVSFQYFMKTFFLDSLFNIICCFMTACNALPTLCARSVPESICLRLSSFDGLYRRLF